MPSNPVATLRHLAHVSKALHQLRPGPRDVVGIPTGVGWLAGEAVARYGRDDNIERVFGTSTIGGGIGERPNLLRGGALLLCKRLYQRWSFRL